ncbi:urea carboxylase [Lentinula aff. lateritia]|uniref:Urea carboxylase n=1 Tax=Lentinula aff. lateritia TaxID=2804960 RepID=A0ACC1UAV1_9AGAR|nr:urea carboxylase [Lentinula aff. lateritia]
MYEGEKLLIANRGEIAVRILRTAKEIGLATLTIYTPSDALAPHVTLADETVALPLVSGQSEARAYCDSKVIISICRSYSVTLLHPGYGFLSEHEEFARTVVAHGITWLGPSSDIIKTMGNKHEARHVAEAAGIAIVPGSKGLVKDEEEAVTVAHQVGFPVILKATAGGGGLGLVVCNNELELFQTFSRTSQHAKALFQNPGLFIEHYFPSAHHIEVQIFGDGRGAVVDMGERECSIQRRHQKIIEESPSPFCLSHPGKFIHKNRLILRLMIKLSFWTVEFIVDDQSAKHFFLEMNTRIQVEHPLTEALYEIDIIKMMIDFGLSQRRNELFLLQENFSSKTNAQHAHAIEARIYSEAPFDSSKPCSGILQHVDLECGHPSWLRVESWISTGTVVTPQFDPLLCKLVVTGLSRAEALDRMATTLASAKIQGPPNNLDSLAQIITNIDFQKGKTTTDFLKRFTYVPCAFTVLSPGLETTVQDLPGRLIGLGIPVSGPMDSTAFKLANILVGNDRNTEGMETVIVAGMDLILHFHAKAVIAVTGKEVIVEFNNVIHDTWTAIEVAQHAILRLRTKEAATTGFRNYIACRGGFPQIPKYLGSKSTSIKFGGYQGRQLMIGDHIAIANPDTLILPLPALPKDIVPQYPKKWTIYVLNGPHNDLEFVESTEKIFNIHWQVSGSSNRQGIRLEGSEKIPWARTNGGDGGSHPSNILDNGYAPGTININGDTPVILTKEGPDMGGYVCLCTVASCNMWILGQLSPGDKIKFIPMTWDSAKQSSNILESWINNIENSLSNHHDCPPMPLAGSLMEHDMQHFDPKLLTIYSTSQNPEVVFRQAGDSTILVEYGPMHLDLSMRACIHAFELEVLKQGVTGIEKFSPCIRSTMCYFDPQKITQSEVLTILAEAARALPNSVTNLYFPGRRFTFPLVLNDQWCNDAILQYMKTIRNNAVYLPSNVEYLAQNNGLGSSQVALKKIIASDHLVLGVGFYLACPFTVPIDPRCRLVGQKMNPSRTYTPRGAVGLAGLVSAIYPVESPGGYQLYGRTLPAWQTWGQGSNFSPDKPWMLQPFDQIHFEVIKEEEYQKLEQQFDAGQYSFKMENCVFSLKDYTDFINSIETETSAFRNKQTKAHEYPLDGLVHFTSPLSAIIWKVLVQSGTTIQHEDETLVILEAMKTQIPVKAGRQYVGRVIKAFGEGVQEGEQVNAGDNLFFLE